LTGEEKEFYENYKEKIDLSSLDQEKLKKLSD
jgi:hypothetical protein